MIEQFNIDNLLILKTLYDEIHVACNFVSGNTVDENTINNLKTKLQSIGVKYHDIPFPRKIFNFKNLIKSFIKVKSLFNIEKFDLVHCQSPIGGFIARIAFNKYRKEKNNKLIYTAHGFHFHKGASFFSWLIYFPIEFLLSRITDVLICITIEDYEFSKKFFRTKTIYINGVGVSLKSYFKSQTFPNGFPEKLTDDFYLVNVGELNENKNQKVILKSLALLNNPNIKLIIFGIGSKRKDLEKLISFYKLKGQVFLLGFQNNIPELLNYCDTFILSSFREGLSLALMEAMAAGLPIIASDIRGNRDLISHSFNGLLFNPRNHIKLASHISFLYNNPNLRKEFSLESKRRITSFSKEIVNNKMKTIYSDLTNNHLAL